VQCLRDAVEFIIEYHRASSYWGYADIPAANDDACHGGFSYHYPHFFYRLPIPASSLSSSHLFFRPCACVPSAEIPAAGQTAG
jgi:hypothetical protein